MSLESLFLGSGPGAENYRSPTVFVLLAGTTGRCWLCSKRVDAGSMTALFPSTHCTSLAEYWNIFERQLVSSADFKVPTVMWPLWVRCSGPSVASWGDAVDITQERIAVVEDWNGTRLNESCRCMLDDKMPDWCCDAAYVPISFYMDRCWSNMTPKLRELVFDWMILSPILTPGRFSSVVDHNTNNSVLSPFNSWYRKHKIS